MDLSIVTTMYYSEEYINEFYNRIKIEAEKITKNYEIIFVNDGSPDNSLDVAVSIQAKDKKVKVVDLSRNFGHHKAMMTGLRIAKGERIFLIDCDLEENPKLLGVFNEKFSNEKNIDVVYGVQGKRKGKFIEKITGELFYKIINKLSGIDMPKNIITARLLSKRYTKSLLEFEEQEIFLAGIWYITGYKQVPVIVDKKSRNKSTYNFSRKISIAINAITSFSNKPLFWIFNFGLAITCIALISIIYLFYKKFYLGINIEGWTSLIISIWFLGGIIIFFIGIIGVYISRIFIETKNRPYTIIRKVYGDDKD